ncbi:MAG: two-component regulator propeller domain-containing protein, partial [Gammaproteobacteria bacterium]
MSDDFTQYQDNFHLKYVISITEYSQDELLISTYSNGIFKVNKLNSELTELDLGVSDVKINQTIKSSGGVHWVATRSHGIFSIYQSSINQFIPNKDDDRSIISKEVISLHEDQNTDLWIGSSEDISYT